MKRRMTVPRVRLLLPLLALAVMAVAWAQGRQNPTETVTKVVENIYVVRNTYGNDGNVAIVVNDEDVTIVDSRVSPARARTLDRIIRGLTPKPLRDVILSHYHHDHSLGVQVFSKPGVQIIGHDYTRYQLLNYNIMEQFTHKFISTTNQIATRERLPKEIEATTDPKRKQELQTQLDRTRMWLDEYLVDVKETRQTPPQVTFQTTMTLHRGSREIRLLYLGRGHTAGDVFTYLPGERIVITGDMPIGYMGDGHVDEWPTTIEELLKIPFETVIPGHGAPAARTEVEKAYREYATYLRHLWSATADLKRQGLSANDAAQKLDLRTYLADTPYQGRGGITGTNLRAVERMYEVMNGKREVTN